MGKLPVCKSTVVDKIQAIQLFFFSIYRFKVIIDVLHQLEHKNTAKLRKKIIFLNSVSSQYTTQDPDVSKTKMQISFYNLTKTFSPAKYGLNVFDLGNKCNINTVFLKQVTTLRLSFSKLFN